MPAPNDPSTHIALKQAFEFARRLLATGRADDRESAVYVMRDLEATKQAGLDDLAWNMYREDNCSHDEVAWLADEVERRWQGEAADASA